MLADEVDYVVGVDTHRDQHALAVVAAPTGAVIAQTIGAADARGYAEALRFAERHAPGVRVWAVEGAGHYGAGLARYLQRRGETVHEVGRTRRGERRLRGKDDPLDAIRAARSALASHSDCTLPRSGQRQEALRAAPARATQRRRRPPRRARPAPQRDRDRARELRDELRRLPLASCSDAAAASAARARAHPTSSRSILVLRSLARRIEAATAEADELEREILDHVRALVPELLDEPGVGPIVAAQLIVTWSHHDRVRSEAAFARLAGVAPLPASSGQTIRHRLSRGGDRQLNRALHTVILHRRQHDPATRDYIARRVAEGKSTRDATRILKRYLARHLYRVMQNASPADDLTVIGDSLSLRKPLVATCRCGSGPGPC